MSASMGHVVYLVFMLLDVSTRFNNLLIGLFEQCRKLNLAADVL